MVWSWGRKGRGEVDDRGKSSSEGIGCLAVVESGMLCTWTGELENGSETVSSFVELEPIFILESLGATVPDNLTLHLKMPGVKWIQVSMVREVKIGRKQVGPWSGSHQGGRV